MNRYNHLQPLVLAFYSKALYRDVGRNWRGVGLLYLLLLAFVCALAFTAHLTLLAKEGVSIAQPYIAQLPTITLANGEVTIDQPEPYLIKQPQTERTVFIIDTTGQTSSLANTTALALLTKNKLIIAYNNATKEYDLSTTKDRVFTAEEVGHNLPRLAYLVVGVVGAFTILTYFLFGVIETLLYAGLTKLFLQTDLTYKTLCRLATVALTPAFIFSAILALFAIHLPYRWLIYIPLSVGYLIYAIKANWEVDAIKQEEAQT